MPIEIVLSLMLVILAGFVVHRLKILPAETTMVLNKFLVNISFPLVIFLGIAKSDLSKINDFLPFVLINCAIISAAYVVVFLIGKLLKLNYARSGALVLGAVTGNIAFMGFPVIKGFFGTAHVEFAYMYIIVFSMTLAFVGLTLVELSQDDQKIDFKKILKKGLLNPLTMSAILGTIALLLQIKFPAVVLDPATSLSQVTTPLALFSIGGFISANFKLQEIKLTLLAVVIKLALLPLLVLVVYSLFKGDVQTAFTVSVMQAAMPTSLTELAIASEYKLDGKIASSTILLTTLLSPLTLVLWATVLR